MAPWHGGGGRPCAHPLASCPPLGSGTWAGGPCRQSPTVWRALHHHRLRAC